MRDKHGFTFGCTCDVSNTLATFINRILMESGSGVETEMKNHNELGGEDRTREDSNIKASPSGKWPYLFSLHCLE